MKILHVIGSLSPADGGPPEAVRQLARAYLSIGVDVEVVSQDPPAAPFLSGLTFPVHALGQRWLGRFGLSPRLWRWLRQNASRFDGIVMNGIWVFPDVAVRAAARHAGKPYAVFPHGALDPWFNKKYPLKHLKKLLYWPSSIRSFVMPAPCYSPPPLSAIWPAPAFAPTAGTACPSPTASASPAAIPRSRSKPS